MARTSRRLQARNTARAKQSARRIVPELEIEVIKTFIGWAKPSIERHAPTGQATATAPLYNVARLVWNRGGLIHRGGQNSALPDLSDVSWMADLMEELALTRATNVETHPWLITNVQVAQGDNGRSKLSLETELQVLVPQLLQSYATDGELSLPPAHKLESSWVLEACRAMVLATQKAVAAATEA
jgi:hypothetical protein